MSTVAIPLLVSAPPWALSSPAGRKRDPHEGFVAQQLPVQLHKVLLLSLHLPSEVTMPQLNLKHSWQLERDRER